MGKTGSIRIEIHDGRRQPWSGGVVQLLVLDPFSHSKKILRDYRTKPGYSRFLFKNLPAEGQKYSVLASARNHRSDGYFPIVPKPGEEVTVKLMLIPKQPAVDLSPFSFELLERESKSFLDALKDTITEKKFRSCKPESRIAAALNIEAKTRSTVVGGKAIGDFLRSFKDVGSLCEDRIYADVDPQLIKHLDESKEFYRVPEWLNKRLHDGFPISFKQAVAFGSIQLSFAGDNGSDTVSADIDIDLYYGLSHLGEYFRNIITQLKTDEFTVYVQLFHQEILPFYHVIQQA